MEKVLSERRGAVALLTLNRPEALNALDHDTLETLERCIAEVAGDASVRALVLTGVGANLFEERDHHAQIAAAIQGTGDPTDPFTRYFADLADDPDSDADALRALISRPGEPLTPDRLAPVTMPVLVLLGDQDFAGPADPLVEALSDVTFSELRRCDHFATPRSMQCIDEALAFVDAAPF